MRKTLVGFAGIAAAVLAVSPANAQQTVKIGVILGYSGQFADPSAQMDNGIKLYMQQHGDTVAGKKIEIIRKDTGGIAPDIAKRLAQELIVRDGVDILAGFALTPNALAAGDVSAQAKKFMVDDECGDRDHHHQIALHGAHLVHRAAAQRNARQWAYKSGIRKIYTMVSDFGPGHDGEAAFQQRFQGRRRRDHRGGPLPGGEPRTSPRSSSAPRTSTPRRSISGRPAARSRRRSARRCPSAASIRSARRCSARAS